MKQKKNIVFYFSDQQRWDTVTPQTTPNLTQLAQEGMMFEQSFTCQPVCGPARACLQTGLYATQCGCAFNGIPLPQELKPLAAYLNEAGYDTAYVGKWHLASDRFQGKGLHCEKTAVPRERQGGYRYWRAADVLEFTSHGYDGYVFDEDGNQIDFQGYRADCINGFALEYIDQAAEKEQPFFLFVSQLEPHHQNDHHCYEGPKELVDKYRDYPIPPDLSFLPGDYKEMYPDYMAAIESLDTNVGRLVQKLKEKGIYDDTVIVYTSDHGSHFKTRNFEYKRSCHDACTHTPLIIKGGGFDGGKTSCELVSLIDLPPTLLDLAGVPVPAHYMGTSILRRIKGEAPARENVFIQISESQIGRAIRTKRYKYCVRAFGSNTIGNTRSKAKVYFEAYLYDLEKDPIERVNLVNSRSPEYVRARKKLKQMLADEMERAGEARPVILHLPFARKK